MHVDLHQLPKQITRDTIIDEIVQLGVPCFSGSCSEVYKEKAFEQENLAPKKPLKNAKLLGENSVMFLVHPTLTVSELEKTCQVLSTVFDKIDNVKLNNK